MSDSLSNQMLAQIELYAHAENYEKQVYVVPRAPRREGRPPSRK
jgi:adenosylhomocysteinase